MELIYTTYEGLHVARPEELYNEALRLINKANELSGRRDRAARTRLKKKAVRYIREANRLVEEEAMLNG